MRRTSIQLLLCLALAAVGCAKPAGVIFPLPEKRVFWPAPPEMARVRYVGQIATSRDLKPAVGFGEQVGNALFGQREAFGMLSPYAVCTDGSDMNIVWTQTGVVQIKITTYGKAEAAWGTNRADYPMFVHCNIDRDRGAVAVAAYRVRVQGWDPAAAQAEAKSFGLKRYFLGLNRYLRSLGE